MTDRFDEWKFPETFDEDTADTFLKFADTFDKDSGDYAVFPWQFPQTFGEGGIDSTQVTASASMNTAAASSASGISSAQFTATATPSNSVIDINQPSEQVTASAAPVSSTVTEDAVSSQITASASVNDGVSLESFTASQVAASASMNGAALLTRGTATQFNSSASMNTTEAVETAQTIPTAYYEPIMQEAVNDPSLQRLDPSDGSVLQSNNIGNELSILKTSQQYLYARTTDADLNNNNDEYLVQIDRETLTENWRVSVNPTTRDDRPRRIQPMIDAVAFINTYNGDIYKYNEDGTQEWVADHYPSSDGSGAEEIAATPDGTILTWSSQNSEFKTWDTDGNLITNELESNLSFTDVTWVTGRSDNVFVVHSGPDQRVSVIDKNLNEQSTYTTGGDPLSLGAVIAGIDENNTVHTLNQSDDTIVSVDTSLTLTEETQLQHDANSIALDNNGGYYYRTGSTDSYLRRANSEGHEIWEINGDAGNVARSPDGSLFPGEYGPQETLTATAVSASVSMNDSFSVEYETATQFTGSADANAAIAAILSDANQFTASAETNSAFAAAENPPSAKITTTSEDGTTLQLSDDLSVDWSVSVDGDSVAADSDGNTYVVASDGNLYKYDSSGSLTSTQGNTNWASVDYNDSVERLVAGNENGDVTIFEGGDFGNSPTNASVTATSASALEQVHINDSNNVYVGSSGSDTPALEKFSADANGFVSSEWTYDPGTSYGITRDIETYSGNVYIAFSSDSILYRLDDTDGSEVSTEFVFPDGAIEVDADGGNVIYSADGSTVRSEPFDSIDGSSPNWEYTTDDGVRGNISLSGGDIYFGDFSGNVYKVDNSNGSEVLKDTTIHSNNVTYVDTYPSAPELVAAPAVASASMNDSISTDVITATTTDTNAVVNVADAVDVTAVFVTPPTASASMSQTVWTEQFDATQFTTSASMRIAVAANITATQTPATATMNAPTLYSFVDESTDSIAVSVTQPQSTLVEGQGESSVPATAFATPLNIIETGRAETSSQKGQVLVARTVNQDTGNASTEADTLQPTATITASDAVPPNLELDSVLNEVDVTVPEPNFIYTVPTETSLISITARDTGTFARRSGFRLPVEIVSRTDLVDVSTKAKIARAQRIRNRGVGETTST